MDFLFVSVTKARNTVTALEHHEFSEARQPEAITRDLREYFQKNELLQHPFKKVVLIHENELSSFVPESMFDEDCLPDYLKFNIKILENDFIAYDSIKNHDLVNVYIPYVNANNFLFEYFGAFEYQHYSSILVSTLLNKAPWKKEACMFVHKHKEHFEIVVLKNRKLLLYNTFTYTAPEDLIYYILFTAEQLDMDPGTFPLYLLGTITEGDAFYEAARTYIRNVVFGEHYCRFSFGEGIQQPKAHENLILLNSF